MTIIFSTAKLQHFPVSPTSSAIYLQSESYLARLALLQSLAFTIRREFLHDVVGTVAIYPFFNKMNPSAK